MTPGLHLACDFLAPVVRGSIATLSPCRPLAIQAYPGLRYTRRVRVRLFLLALALCTASLGGPIALAQEQPGRESEFIDGLMETLSPRKKVSQLFIYGDCACLTW